MLRMTSKVLTSLQALMRKSPIFTHVNKRITSPLLRKKSSSMKNRLLITAIATCTLETSTQGRRTTKVSSEVGAAEAKRPSLTRSSLISKNITS
jgi:hypothetical protein